MSPRKKEAFRKMQDASREKILYAAFELFAEQGYVTTSVDKIAKKANISKGLIYHYFKSKEEILLGIFEVLLNNLNQIVVKWEDLLPEKYIENMIEHSFQFIIQQTNINRFIIALTVQPKVIQDIKGALEKVKIGWMSQLVFMFSELKYENPKAEAYLMGSIFDGVGIGFITLGDDYPIEEVRQLVREKYNIK